MPASSEARSERFVGDMVVLKAVGMRHVPDFTCAWPALLALRCSLLSATTGCRYHYHISYKLAFT